MDDTGAVIHGTDMEGGCDDAVSKHDVFREYGAEGAPRVRWRGFTENPGSWAVWESPAA